MKSDLHPTTVAKDPQFWIPKALKGRRYNQVGFIGEKSGITAQDHTTDKTFVVREPFGLAVYAR